LQAPGQFHQTQNTCKKITFILASLVRFKDFVSVFKHL
jgi:hypothetical protein